MGVATSWMVQKKNLVDLHTNLNTFATIVAEQSPLITPGELPLRW